MDDAKLIRAIFARIQEEPERGRAALRAKIVRALRGEVPHGVPWQEDHCMVEEITLEQRAARGREIIAQRRDEEQRGRAEKFEALRKFILADLEPELHPHLGQLREQPETPDDYVLRIEPVGYAPIVARYFFHVGAWKRGQHGYRCPWAVIPAPAAPEPHWHRCETLDEALAVAQEHWSDWYGLPKGPKVLPPREKRGWWRRLCDAIVLRCGVGAFGEFE